MILTLKSYSQHKAEKNQITHLFGSKQQQNFYRKLLQIDSNKAIEVTKIQSDYKALLTLIESDTSLNEVSRRIRIQAAIEGKNQMLQHLLNPAQQAKIIPTTERKSAATEKKP